MNACIFPMNPEAEPQGQFELDEKRGELRRSAASPVLKRLYAMLEGFGAASARRGIMRTLRWLESSEMRSATMRRIMRECHGVEIGAHSYGCFDPVRFPAGTRIARYVSVGSGVRVFRRSHPVERLSLHPYFFNPKIGAPATADVRTEPLCIDDGVWIGGNAIILPGCRRIGRGAVVAAGSVVTRDVPAYAMVGGNPAQLMQPRFDDAATWAAEKSAWWTMEPERVAASFDVQGSWVEGPWHGIWRQDGLPWA